MLTKNQLKDIFEKYDFRPLKRLGENYLIDGNIKDKIIKELDPGKGDVILEIGPGLGALTFDIANSGAQLYAVEKDKKAFVALKDILGGDFPNSELFCQDILDFDFNLMRPSRNMTLPGLKAGGFHSSGANPAPSIPGLKSGALGGGIKVVGNLPYYITTPIIEKLFENRSRIKSILMTIQREVANRLLALPGSADYSSISCFVQYHTKPEYIYTIKRTAFYPEPEVDSSLIRLDILEKPAVSVKNEKLFFKIVRGSFNQRRKSIINSLSRKEVLDMPKAELAKVLEREGIDPARRPERLSLSDFAKISEAMRV